MEVLMASSHRIRCYRRGFIGKELTSKLTASDAAS
jgi:hypothetical protein